MWWGIIYAGCLWLMGERRQWSLPLAQGLPAVWMRVGVGAAWAVAAAAAAGPGTAGSGAAGAGARWSTSDWWAGVAVAARVQGLRGRRVRRRRWGWVCQKAAQRPERCRARRLARRWAPGVLQRMPAWTWRAWIRFLAQDS